MLVDKIKSKSSLKNVLSNSLVILSGNIGSNLFGVFSIAIFTNSMGAEIFGYYVLFLTYVDIIYKIFNFQTWQSFIKYATDFRIKNENYNVIMLLKYSFLIDFFSLGIAFVIAFISVGIFLKTFNIPAEYTSILCIMTFSILTKVFEISSGIFRLFDEFKVQSRILVCAAVFKLLLFYSISLFSPSFENFIYATLLSQLFDVSLKLKYSVGILKSNNITILSIIKEKVNIDLIKKLKIFSFIVYNNFDVSVRMVSRQLDIVVLGKLYGAEVVGVYRIAKEIANVIARLTDPIYQAIYPELAKLLASAKKKEAKEMAKKISLYAGLCGIVFYIVFAILGVWGIELIFGEGFSHAYDVTMVYLLAVFIALISLPIVPLLHSGGHAREAFFNQLWSTLGYLIVIYPLSLMYSSVGAAIAYICFYLIWFSMAIKTITNNKVLI